MRKAGLILAFVVVIVAVAITFTIGWRPIIGPRHRALTSRRFEKTPQRLARGEYLVQHVSMCVGCHSSLDFNSHRLAVIPNTLLAGSHVDEKGMPGDFYSPNLTPDPATGAGSWTDDQLARSIREGIGHDGRALFPMMPYERFHSMSDEDLASVVVYLRSLPPVHHEQPASQIIFPVKYLIRSVPEPLTDAVPDADRSTPERRGAYLANLATCSDCHTPRDDKGQPLAGLEFSGGNVFEGPWGLVTSGNITPDASGIGYYDTPRFLEALHRGYVGARQLNQIMPWSFYTGMTDSDLTDIFAYLKTLEPVRHHVDNSLPPTYCKVCRNRHGGGDQNTLTADAR